MKEDAEILVVDDEAIMRNLLLKILESEGYRVTLANCFDEAMDHMARQQFEIVLADVKMPGANGFDLLREIKKQWPKTAVIVMTGYGDAFTVKEALMRGADEYITKPFKSHEISLIIERAYWRQLASNRSDFINQNAEEQDLMVQIAQNARSKAIIDLIGIKLGINISSDEMIVHLVIEQSHKAQDLLFSEEDLKEIINSTGIVYGIN